jgi:hypothetical protein
VPLSAALQPWQNFFMLTGAAAATLTGLMFIAVTFGESLVTKATSSTARAFLDPIFMHFVQVLFTGCLLMIPTLTDVALGTVLLVLGGFRLVSLRWIFRRYVGAQRTSGDLDTSDWVAGIVLPILLHLLLIASGVGFLRHERASLMGLALTSLGILLIGIYSAWELLVWMAVAVTDHRDARAATKRPDAVSQGVAAKERNRAGE